MSERDAGIYDALNKGIRMASGEVVGFLHCDDLFAGPGVIARIADEFSDRDVQAIYGDLVYVRKDDPQKVVRWWKSGRYERRKLGAGWMPPHPTFYVRKAVYEKLGAFDLNYRIAADYDCILRILARGGVQPRYIPEVLVRMRVGGVSNRSLRNILRKSAEDYRALRANGVGGVATLAMKNLSKIPQFFRRPRSVS